MKFSRICMIAAAVTVLSSCASKRSPLTYFADIDQSTIAYQTGDYSIKIEPADELLITVTSTNPEATAPYNIPIVNPGTTALMGVASQPQQQTYIVDTKGNIQLPIIGTIHVQGMTIEQLQELLTKKISADVADPLVRVELLNFKINVAGEVKNPGQIEVKDRRFSVLDALTAAGDLTEYAERNNVLIVREENGKKISGRIDLNSASTLNSPFFYLKQNDYIYVEPNKIRKDNSGYNQNNAFKLSVISTIVSGCSVVASLIIALSK